MLLIVGEDELIVKEDGDKLAAADFVIYWDPRQGTATIDSVTIMTLVGYRSNETLKSFSAAVLPGVYATILDTVDEMEREGQHNVRKVCFVARTADSGIT